MAPHMGSRSGGLAVLAVYCGGFPKLGFFFWWVNNKAYSILGSILGSFFLQFLGKLPYRTSPKDLGCGSRLQS